MYRIDDNICTHVSVNSDTRDLLTLSDFTKLKPFITTAVRVNVPTRFNRRLIEIAPFKPIRGHVVIERAINIPTPGSTEFIFINTSNKPVYLSKAMNVATCELLLDNEITAITKLTADAPPKFTSDSTGDSDLIFFNPPYSKSNPSTLSGEAPTFKPREDSRKSNDSSPPTNNNKPTITLNEKCNVSKTIGLNLGQCFIQTA